MDQKVSQEETFSPFVIEDLPDIVRGHEIWVEHGMQNVLFGDLVVTLLRSVPQRIAY